MQEKEQLETQQLENDKIKEYGQVRLESEGEHGAIEVVTIIGEIEGHDCLPQSTKVTKYEHVLPQLAKLESDDTVGGVLLLLHTVGGDVESGLAIAEMIASLSKPTVSLVLGGSHSIGGPLAVAADYSFIVPTGTMIIHPVRLNGTVLGAPQTYDYFQLLENRIVGFIANHSFATTDRLSEMMLQSGMLTKDLGTILVGEDAVREGLIDEVGGMKEAVQKLHEMIARET